ncbi:MAG: class I SAM-dependent methyltransferase [Thermoplasmata archaeon]
MRLEQADPIGTTVLDIECGTGENALYLAQQGHEGWGVDASSRAIAKARAKSKRRRIPGHPRSGRVLLCAGLLRPRASGLGQDSPYHPRGDPDHVS